MLQVFYSNKLERLVDAAVEAVVYERRRLEQNPLVQTPVVVPNGNLETYLKYQFARRRGISGHVVYRRPIELFESLLPDAGDYQIIGDRSVQRLIIEALTDPELIDQDALDAVRSYVAAAGDDRDARALRRFQLSSHLVNLFRGYDYNRPDMIAEWSGRRPRRAPDGHRFDQSSWQRLSQWQRAIWRDIFAAGGRLDRLSQADDTHYLRLAAIFDTPDPDGLQIPAGVHFFAPGHLGKLFEGLLGQLGERTDVFVWAMNPCREFWEDVVTDIDQEGHLLSSRPVTDGQLTLLEADGGEAFWEPETFPLPLRLWGRVGRDHVRMLNRLSAHEPRGLFERPSVRADAHAPPKGPAGRPNRVLWQLQQDVLNLEDERDEPIDGLDDDSITVLACPGVKREAEIIANEIWALMRGERTLGHPGPVDFNDIAVIVNRDQRDAYQTHIQSVFRNVHDIPFNMCDLDVASNSLIFEALALLLDLPFGRFKRRQFLKLLAHPNVVAQFDDVQPELWMRWCDELNIVHGADHADHADTYIDRDLFNWDQGLKRLVLGGFMSGPASGDERVFRHDPFQYLPFDYPRGESAAAAQLVMTARAMIDDARRFRRDERPLSQWFERIGACFDRYFAPVDDDETFEFMRCRRLLADLADEEAASRQQTDPADARPAVPYRIAREFVGQAVDKLDMRRGQYLADGVVVSSFVPKRPLPFRVVFMAGMGEAYMPTSDGVDPLDLRGARWREGDAGGRDRDRYAFLQTLMATRDRLYLSYVSRDSRTGEPLEASPVVRNLVHMLEQGYLGAEPLERCLQEHPLRRFDSVYFDDGRDADQSDSRNDSATATNYHPEARREAAARAMHESLREHCRAHGVAYPDRAMLEDAVSEPVQRQVTGLLGGYARPDVSSADQLPEAASISLSQIRQFLESPLQASARWILGRRPEDATDLLDVEDEVFESSYVDSLMLARDVFLETLTQEAPDDGPNFLPAYEQEAQLLELRGELPTGPFQQVERTKQLELVEIWHENMQILGVPGDAPLQLERVGRGTRDTPVDQIWESISFECRLDGPDRRQSDPQRCRVELYGDTEALDARHTTAVTLVSRKRVKDKDFLRGFLTQLALAATGHLRVDQPFDAVVVPGKSLTGARKLAKYRRRFAPISPQQAVEYLQGLSADFLDGVHAYVMPVEAVFEYVAPDNDTTFSELVANRLESRWKHCSSEYGPVRQPARFPAPEHPDALIERRFGPLFERLVEET